MGIENMIKLDVVQKPEDLKERRSANNSLLYDEIFRTIVLIDSTKTIKLSGKDKLKKHQIPYLKQLGKKKNMRVCVNEKNDVQYIWKK